MCCGALSLWGSVIAPTGGLPPMNHKFLECLTKGAASLDLLFAVPSSVRHTRELAEDQCPSGASSEAGDLPAGAMRGHPRPNTVLPVLWGLLLLPSGLQVHFHFTRPGSLQERPSRLHRPLPASCSIPNPLSLLSRLSFSQTP